MQRFIHWLLNWPVPAYESIKKNVWMHKRIRLWDRIRYNLAAWLMTKGG